MVQRSSKQGVLEEMGALDADAPVEEGKDFSQKLQLIFLVLHSLKLTVRP